MYARDSFFDLSAWGQVGLAALSALLFLAIVALTHFATRRMALWSRVLIGLVAFWAFVWLSPQVYYMYYRMIIPALPLQWVIKPPVGPQRLIQLLTFQWRANLSAHGQGLLGWCLILWPVLHWWRRSRAKPGAGTGP
ncbi:MAG: hypothetical protein AB3N11_09995 [Arenibacterium sp.]